MKTTVKKIRELVREALEQPKFLGDLSREEAIVWLARWAEGEMQFKDPKKGPTKFATKWVDERKGPFKVLSVPFVKDKVLLATDVDVLDPYGDPAGWVTIESLFAPPEDF